MEVVDAELVERATQAIVCEHCGAEGVITYSTVQLGAMVKYRVDMPICCPAVEAGVNEMELEPVN